MSVRVRFPPEAQNPESRWGAKGTKTAYAFRALYPGKGPPRHLRASIAIHSAHGLSQPLIDCFGKVMRGIVGIIFPIHPSSESVGHDVVAFLGNGPCVLIAKEHVSKRV